MEILVVRHARLLTLLCVFGIAHAQSAFRIHSFHAAKLGRLDCNLCHTPLTKGSVELKRPGHDQCRYCHAPAFDTNNDALICAQCHSASPAPGDDLLPFPRVNSPRSVLSRFSHASHVDPRSRIEASNGFRADCVFCHQFPGEGVRARIPSHTQCAACHGKPGTEPELTPFLRTAGCRGCHAPEKGEDPRDADITRYPRIQFSHAAHFRIRDRYRVDCLTCHAAIPGAEGFSAASLPTMVDCAACHNAGRALAAQFRLTNCKLCHVEAETTSLAAEAFTPSVKPPSHTAAFRIHHSDAAAAPDAKCFACHQNIAPAAKSRDQCASCHALMRPASHTARWMDDLHGKFAALDRIACQTCHTGDYCIRCHNELPRSHAPLPLFKNGGHANLAMLNERACLTCHSFQNTCAQCHSQGERPNTVKR